MRFKAFAGAAVVVLWVAALSACEAEAPDNTVPNPPPPAAMTAPTSTPTVPLPTAIPVPTPTPAVAPTPTATPTATPTPTAEELAAAHLSEIIPWFENPQAAPFGIAELLVDLWVRDRDLGNAVVGLPWVTDRVDVVEAGVLYKLRDIAVIDLVLGQQIVRYPWFADSIIDDEWRALDTLDSIASRDIELAKVLAGLSWFADGITTDEWPILGVLDSGVLDSIVSKDIELAQMVANLPWLGDDVTSPERATIYALSNIASRDIGLARTVARASWFADSITDYEWLALDTLDSIVSQDIELAKVVAGLPWFADGITTDEWPVLGVLDSIASQDIELAQMVASLPWLGDDVTSLERETFYALSNIASKDIGLARTVARGSWFADSITDDEWLALDTLDSIASQDIELAQMVASLPWLGDDVTKSERDDLRNLNVIASQDIDLARVAVSPPWFAAYVTEGWRGNPRSYLLKGLSRIASQGVDAVDQLTAQPWFADGLNREEVAFVTTLGDVISSSSTLYHDLLQTHFTQTRTVSLRLAGDVNIWIFQNTPFPAGEDLLTVIEDTARMSEGLLGAPFPTSDIILLVVDHSDKRYRIGPGHVGTSMRLNRYPSGVWHLPHETAHYYFFNPITGPRWLTEGGAEFIAVYFNHRTGVRDLADERARAFRANQSCVDNYLMENIRHLTLVLTNNWEILHPSGCVYKMGENFLHSASMVMGEEALMSALGELHLLEVGRDRHTVEGRIHVEERIYEVLLKHAPADRQEDFRDLYRELHGGAAAFADTDFVDDHGDEAIAATDIEVRKAVHGTLDYMFDFDYFLFQAQEGQKYQMKVNHETLRSTSVGLYTPDGLTGENRRWQFRDLVSSGPRIVWTAPSSEEHYFAVHNFGGKTGAYTLEITPVERSVQDDHGDTAATATEILVGGTVQGTVDDNLDIDYFRFQVETGQKYVLEIVSGTLNEFRLRLYLPNRQSLRRTERQYRSMLPPGVRWTARGSGEASLAIDSADRSVGTYTFKLVLVDNEPGD